VLLDAVSGAKTLYPEGPLTPKLVIVGPWLLDPVGGVRFWVLTAVLAEETGRRH